MFTLKSRITIGGRTFDRITDVAVMRSVHHIAGTATVKMPAPSPGSLGNGVAAKQNANPDAIQAGDTVKIELAYNADWHTEFQGYVRELRYTTLLEIVCEDEYYVTRSKEASVSGQAVKLTDVLADCGLEVGQADDLELKNFVVDQKPVCHILQRLKTAYGLKIFFDTAGKVYALADSEHRLTEVRYELRKNVIRQEARDLITFLQPFAEPCMTAALTDPDHAGQNGQFAIEAVQVIFGPYGARRIVSLGEPA